MMATFNSRCLAPTERDRPGRSRVERTSRAVISGTLSRARVAATGDGRAPGAILLAVIFLGLTVLALPAHADSDATNQARFARKAEAAFKSARARFEQETNSAEAAWQFGRACYDWADFAASSTQRAGIAQLGIAACRSLVASSTNSAPGHYYLALNLSQLARTKTLGALKIVEQMEQEFSSALSLDPKYDFAGADRGLALLYAEAPGWPVSVGSRSKAKSHLQNALKLCPGYPENLLSLAAVELKFGDRAGALRDLKALDELWPGAQKQFAGDAWESSWADWDKRRGELRQKANEAPRAPGRPGR
jgi:tetratricopeptide (TPR) repeat protein